MRDPIILSQAVIEQRQLLDKAAQIMGTTREIFIMEAACDKAQSLLLNQALVDLNEAKFHAFLGAFQKVMDTAPTRTLGHKRPLRVKPSRSCTTIA